MFVGCAGTFAQPYDTIGICTQGQYKGCPCEKCGSGDGFTGKCNMNGCDGVQGTCTGGNFKGCPCN